MDLGGCPSAGVGKHLWRDAPVHDGHRVFATADRVGAPRPVDPLLDHRLAKVASSKVAPHDGGESVVGRLEKLMVLMTILVKANATYTVALWDFEGGAKSYECY
jgi:hypothetical protein